MNSYIVLTQRRDSESRVTLFLIAVEFINIISLWETPHPLFPPLRSAERGTKGERRLKAAPPFN